MFSFLDSSLHAKWITFGCSLCSNEIFVLGVVLTPSVGGLMAVSVGKWYWLMATGSVSECKLHNASPEDKDCRRNGTLTGRLKAKYGVPTL